jgi:hypothetical protein
MAYLVDRHRQNSALWRWLAERICHCHVNINGSAVDCPQGKETNPKVIFCGNEMAIPIATIATSFLMTL